MKKLYVGCALTHAPDNFRQAVELLKMHLETDGWEVMKFLGITAGTSADVYENDIDANVRKCDVFLAIADHPSTGLGWELGVADERHVPTLVVAHHNSKVTRLIQGAGDIRPHVSFKRYSTMEEIPDMLSAFMQDQNLA